MKVSVIDEETIKYCMEITHEDCITYVDEKYLLQLLRDMTKEVIKLRKENNKNHEKL